jgi:hypothetical protein
LFIVAGLLSTGVSALGIGIYLWGSSPSHPNLQGALLCAGPALSLLFFMTAIWSRNWNRWIMWLLALASLCGAFMANLGVGLHDHIAPMNIGTVGLDALRFPPAALSVLVAILIEASYRLRLQTAERTP